jgi:hypothetical protein
MRPYWKGYLKLALVSCPIALHAACSSAERIAFRQINKATGNRLRQQLIDEETREPVAPEHKGRGYEVAKGHYLIVEDAELEAIEIESRHTIEIDRFVPHSAMPQVAMRRGYCSSASPASRGNRPPPRLRDPHTRSLAPVAGCYDALCRCRREPGTHQVGQHLDVKPSASIIASMQPWRQDASSVCGAAFPCRFVAEMVGAVGIEPTTSPV